MDKDTLGEMVVLSEEQFDMMEADLDQMNRFIGFLMSNLEECGEDTVALEMEFLKSEDPTEGDVH